jgi:hypothetical protein
MKALMPHDDHCGARPVSTGQQRWSRLGSKREEGQSLVEMTVGLVFLLIIVLILFEMGMLFYSYIAVLNASREGAVYASLVPDMNDEQYVHYKTITSAEAEAAGLNTDPSFFVVDRPETPDGIDPLDRVIVRVHYQIINPTQGIVLPFLGRMGLFQSAWMTGVTEMPIR